jgi:hypothetical protein
VEAQLFESPVFDKGLLTIVHILELRRWGVAGVLEEPAVVEPVNPLEPGELHVFEGLPGAALSDELGLEKPVDGFRQSPRGSQRRSAALESSSRSSGESVSNALEQARAFLPTAL